MNNAFLASFNCLDKIYTDKAFSTQELNRTLLFANAKDKALVTKIVYGVLDCDIELDYIVNLHCQKAKPKLKLYLKMGTYILKYLSMPVYAVVNDVVELVKVTKKRQLVGFVNATLKSIAKSLQEGIEYPQDELEALSVKYSYPLWALKKLIKDYGKDVAKEIISYQLPKQNNCRVNTNLISTKDFEKLLIDLKADYKQGHFENCFSISGKLEVDTKYYTVQSTSSMYVCHALNTSGKVSILDCCSAPGGKAVYLKTLNRKADVVACDLYPHRVNLINEYANRMGVEIETHVLDSTKTNEEFLNKFDYVLCDVPCSGFGVLDNHPDIKLFRENAHLHELILTQREILKNCSQYVKKGGVLVYSTCSVFNNENVDNVKRFLAENPDFQLEKLPIDKVNDGTYQFLPHKDFTQGFFVARMVKTK